MKRTAALLTCLALLIPGAAVASASSSGGSSSGSYSSNHNASKVDHASASRTPKHSTGPASSTRTTPSAVQATTATRTASTGSLPFTGLDIGALAGGAIVLLGAGLVLRRVSAANRT